MSDQFCSCRFPGGPSTTWCTHCHLPLHRERDEYERDQPKLQPAPKKKRGKR